MLRDGAAGELLPPGDVDVWLGRLQNLMASADQREDLATKARFHASHYDIRTTAERWFRLLARRSM